MSLNDEEKELIYAGKLFLAFCIPLLLAGIIFVYLEKYFLTLCLILIILLNLTIGLAMIYLSKKQ